MDYEQFKLPVYELTHIDLNCYKERQMKRRIDALIAKHNINGYSEYVESLKNNKKIFEEFISSILPSMYPNFIETLTNGRF